MAFISLQRSSCTGKPVNVYEMHWLRNKTLVSLKKMHNCEIKDSLFEKKWPAKFQIKCWYLN